MRFSILILYYFLFSFYTRCVTFPKTQQNASLIQFKFELYEFLHNRLVIKTIAILHEIRVYFRTGNIERNS